MRAEVVQPTLLELEPDQSPTRHVEVAIDAIGTGGARTYTYRVPAQLADVEPGEAVLVEFGRRQALAIVLGDTPPPAGIATKAILERVRADGPLLPPLSLALARWVSETYLAPPAVVLRAMLPPGMLERLELVAELRPGTDAQGAGLLPGSVAHDSAAAAAEMATDSAAPGAGQLPDWGARAPGETTLELDTPTTDSAALSPADSALLEQLEAAPSAVRDLSSQEGRAGLLRRLRALAARGLVSLEWTLTSASAGPRFERWARLSEAGRAAADLLACGDRPPGARLGQRQVALLGDLRVEDVAGLPGALLAGRHGTSALASLVRRGLLEVEIRERPRRPLEARPPGPRGSRPPMSDMTPAQAEALALVERAIAERDSTPLLLEGVTGGGKTAVYAEAIARTLDGGRRVLMLVPEIALAMPLVDRLRADLDASVALVHSGLGEGERADEWRRIREGGADIVVGTRLAVLAPLADVGLVVVDEEHDPAYKSDRTPRLQARDAALALARAAGAAVVLGSATPAVDTYGRALDETYRRVVLPNRPTGSAPRVEVVDLRAELAAGNRGLLSRPLADAVRQLDVGAGERAILTINRRGTASVVLCRDCGEVQRCPDCDRPLVFHQAGFTLRCHHCGRATPLASRCPACHSPRIRYLGGGTERVEREVRERFPDLRVGRLDRDVVERKGAADRIVDAFTGGRLDVLVGTSLVTKGLDIPEVTLVGVVSADIALNLPDERAAERTYQLLAQAVGRAGRGERAGRAIIQSYQPDHPAIQAVATAEPAAFYEAELALRRRFGSPPFGRLVKLTVSLPERDAAEHQAIVLAQRLRERAREREVAVTIVGPAPAYIARRGDRWRFNLVLRGPAPAALLDGGLDAPWSVDVDPESLL